MSVLSDLRKVRRVSYRFGAALGDLIAVVSGPKAVGRRAVRKVGWRLLGRLARQAGL